MKQHITTEQLAELDDKGKAKLKEWWKPEYDDTQVLMYLPEQDGRIIGGDWDQEINVYDMKSLEIELTQKLKNYQGIMYPLPSIGQMIEFLNNCEETIVIAKLGDKWRIEYGWDIQQDTELCDALWKVVKYILQNEK